jgi:hypothetical protein
MTAFTEPWPHCLVYVLHRAHTLDGVATGCGVGGVCVLVAT